MQIVVTPSKELVQRATKRNWDKRDERFLFNGNRTAGLCLKKPFEPIVYIGTVTFLRHKIRADKAYAFTTKGPVYSGDLIKEALKILGKRRVRVFFHIPLDGDKTYMPLLLGTKEGTIAIAPRIWDEDKKLFVDENVELISGYIKTCTSKFKRGIIFGTL